VFDPLGLCAEIANEIPGSVAMMMGQCIYEDTRMLTSAQTAPVLSDLKSDDGSDNISPEKLMAASSKISGPKEYFLKERKFEDQMEYRMIWETNRPVEEPVIIKVLNPERFCRRLQRRDE